MAVSAANSNDVHDMACAVDSHQLCFGGASQPPQLYLLPIETANAHEMGCAVDAYPAAKKMPT